MVLDSDRAKQLCRRHKVAIVKVLATAATMARVADGRTGGRITMTTEHLADSAGMTWNVLRRGRRVLRELDLAYEVARGRMLRGEEVQAARAHHGGYQSRAASTWALTSPAYAVELLAQIRATPRGRRRYPQVKTRVHLSSSTPVRESSSVGKNSPTRPREARKRAQISPKQIRPLHAHRAAAQIAAELGDLRMGHSMTLPRQAVRTRHIGALIDALGRAGVDTERWDGHAVVARINADSAARGWTPPRRLTNPVGWLYRRLSALDWNVPTPRELALERQRQITAEAKARREAIAESRRRAAAPNSARRLHAVRNWKSYKNLTDADINDLTA